MKIQYPDTSILYLHITSPINCLAKYPMGENYQILTEDYVHHLWLLHLYSLEMCFCVKYLLLHESQRILIYLQSGVTLTRKKRTFCIWVQCHSAIIQDKTQQKALYCLTAFSVIEIRSGRELVFKFSPSTDTGLIHSTAS